MINFVESVLRRSLVKPKMPHDVRPRALMLKIGESCLDRLNKIKLILMFNGTRSILIAIQSTARIRSIYSTYWIVECLLRGCSGNDVSIESVWFGRLDPGYSRF